MKKLVAGAAVAALLGSAAFADVSVGAWGRAVTGIGNRANKSSDGTDVAISNMQSWGDNGPRFGITFSGDHDGVIGFTAQAFLNGQTGWDVGDVATVWYAPIEQLKVWLGKDNCGNPLRGDACYGTWDIKRVGTMDGGYHEGWTFQGQASTGAAIGVFPIEGLSFYASFDYPYQVNIDKTDESSGWTDANLANVVGRHSKYALAYAIGGDEGIATIKLGLEEKGKVAHNKDGETKDQNIINAAVDLKPMENLFISLGAFVPMVQYSCDDDGKTTGSADYLTSDFDRSAFDRVNAYVRFGAMEGLNIHAQFGTVINSFDTKELKKDNKDGKLGFLVAGGVDYKLMDDLTLYADAGYANGIYMAGTSADHSDCMNFGLGVTKDYGEGCSVSAGFVGATNGYGMYDTTYTDNGDTKYPFSWGIPLVITYSF